MFIWNKDDLNKEQVKAIEHDGNVMLIACPGSGKTRTLTYKIALELSKYTGSRQFVIAITYTNRAADEIKDRIELLGVDTSQLWIGTIHSFCLEWILRPYSKYIPNLKYGFRVINSFESEETLSFLCDNYNEKHDLKGWDKITHYDCGYIASSDSGFKISCKEQQKTEGVLEILEKYFQILIQNNQIDFEHILQYSNDIINKKSGIGVILNNLFSYILVDEYQDTKEVQYSIIGTILKSGQKKANLFIVGDPNQAIYYTLGGYPIELDDLQRTCNLKIEKFELSKNYRSSKTIIDYFEYYNTFENNVVPFGIHKDHNSIITLDIDTHRDDLIDEIADLIVKSIEEYGIPQNEICVLAPQWVHLASVTRKLLLKLPEYSFDGPGMTPFSRDLENLFYKLTRIILTEPSPDMYIRRLRWANEVIHDFISNGVDIGNLTKKQLLKKCNSIEIQEDDGLSYLKEFFLKLFLELDINQSSSIYLTEHFESFFNSSTSRIERLKSEGIEYIGNTDTFKKVFRQRKGITVSTFHGVKGAEFDTVICFALLNGYIPHWFDKDNPVLNSKKLLYVISSRARKNLHLIAERGRFTNGGNEYRTTQHIQEYKYDYD